jgi:biotin carboxyl carrier protein
MLKGLAWITNLPFFLALSQGQVIKKGQVVCYLEQLGTQQPIEVISNPLAALLLRGLLR